MVHIDDNYPTPTSAAQKATLKHLVKPYPSSDLADTNHSKISQGILDTNLHLGYLGRHLLQGLPARYVSQDASQPWLLFWSLQSLSLLKVELDEGNKKRVGDTVISMQDTSAGGFGGGPGQAAHLLPTYAAVCALAIAGSPSHFAQIDRAALYRFYLSLKEPDGSFRVSANGEVDVRGVYCLLSTAKLTGIITPELVKGTKEWIQACQTYEGGFASGALGVGHGSQSAPLGEAHGGYTFCALAAWVLLEAEFPSSPSDPKLNLGSLRRWLVNMQGSEDELYGFRGRTNKLVDGCYSWWVGGCFPLLDTLDRLDGRVQADAELEEQIWNPEGLKEYILFAAQHSAGGLRDKPPKTSDLYHTLYCLAGLSAAEYSIQSFSSTPQSSALNATDPLFNLTRTHAEGMIEYFRSGERKEFR
ncbi:terpenoid cyclases/protein prenyltransferase alpha-alpha toroid [Rhodocollybia butyracea]|uniref:Protein farnesyltransferase subunit beta n=1 Tax=Rhodocollybia butyracea TaxID=206335 RepID=A0A9P5Q0C1_9AGAR|nr:terpenoid cyclases/protein prenyltransferase alpha-alpha toroid [Rhodocollybia butyracea]